MSYKIINSTNLNVYLEDIGIRLNGKGSFAMVSENEFQKSKSLKELSGLLTIIKKSEFSVWPLSKRPKILLPVNSSVPKSPNKVSTPPLVSTKPDISITKPVIDMTVINNKPILNKPVEPNPAISDKIDNLVSKISEFIEQMQNMQKLGSMSTHGSALPSASSISFKDDVFIPVKVVPEQVDVSIQKKESSQERPDVEEATKALRKMRSKK